MVQIGNGDGSTATTPDIKVSSPTVSSSKVKPAKLICVEKIETGNGYYVGEVYDQLSNKLVLSPRDSSSTSARVNYWGAKWELVSSSYKLMKLCDFGLVTYNEAIAKYKEVFGEEP